MDKLTRIDNHRLDDGQIGPIPLDDGQIGPIPLDDGQIGPIPLDDGQIGPIPLDDGQIGPIPLDDGQIGPIPLDDGQIGPIPLDDGQIGHHCGIAYVRSRKDYDTLAKKYSDPYFLLNLVYLMLLRQRNRGLDGAGIATAFIPYTDYVEQEYMFKDKMISKDAVSDLYESLMQKDHTGKCLADQRKGDCMIGHVLYSTMLSTVSYRYVHPVEHQDPWPHRRITIAMNGNFANNSEQREFLRSVGQAPTSRSDMEALVESFGHFLGLAHIRMMQRGLSPEEISEQLDLVAVMRKVNQQLQGAFALEGIVGNGDSFLARDPFGIRPLYYAIHDDSSSELVSGVRFNPHLLQWA